MGDRFDFDVGIELLDFQEISDRLFLSRGYPLGITESCGPNSP
jgi:hypothetical protein